MNTFTFEAIAIEIFLEGTFYVFGTYYRSNKYVTFNHSSVSFGPFFDDLISFLEISNSKKCKSYTSSDTNINMLKKKQVVNDYLINILSSGFFPLNFGATRFIDKNNFSLLDYIISNDNPKSPIIFQNVQSISDHNMIFFPIDIITDKHRQDIHIIKRQITENNILLFKSMFERETWLNVFSSTMVEAAANEFNNI